MKVYKLRQVLFIPLFLFGQKKELFKRLSLCLNVSQWTFSDDESCVGMKVFVRDAQDVTMQITLEDGTGLKLGVRSAKLYVFENGVAILALTVELYIEVEKALDFEVVTAYLDQFRRSYLAYWDDEDDEYLYAAKVIDGGNEVIKESFDESRCLFPPEKKPLKKMWEFFLSPLTQSEQFLCETNFRFLGGEKLCYMSYLVIFQNARIENIQIRALDKDNIFTVFLYEGDYCYDRTWEQEQQQLLMDFFQKTSLLLLEDLSKKHLKYNLSHRIALPGYRLTAFLKQLIELDERYAVSKNERLGIKEIFGRVNHLLQREHYLQASSRRPLFF